MNTPVVVSDPRIRRGRIITRDDSFAELAIAGEIIQGKVSSVHMSMDVYHGRARLWATIGERTMRFEDEFYVPDGDAQLVETCFQLLVDQRDKWQFCDV